MSPAPPPMWRWKPCGTRAAIPAPRVVIDAIRKDDGGFCLVSGELPVTITLMEPRSSRRQRNAPTINDVAKHAGVSPMTVSRVINGEQIVRSATKEKVEAAIAALNYSLSAAASRLAGEDETHIGLPHITPSPPLLSHFPF